MITISFPITVRVLLSGHPRASENWPLNRGWPFNRLRYNLNWVEMAVNMIYRLYMAKYLLKSVYM